MGKNQTKKPQKYSTVRPGRQIRCLVDYDRWDRIVRLRNCPCFLSANSSEKRSWFWNGL